MLSFNQITLIAFIIASNIIICPISILAKKYETIKGPIAVKLIRVIDGDTAIFQLYFFNNSIESSVRFKGFDTPELKGKCKKEIIYANKAKYKLTKLLNTAQKITLTNLTKQPYDTRIIADAFVDGKSVKKIMLNDSNILAKKYKRGFKINWCKKIITYDKKNN